MGHNGNGDLLGRLCVDNNYYKAMYGNCRSDVIVDESVISDPIYYYVGSVGTYMYSKI